MRHARSCAALAALVLCVLPPSCAWTNRDNRPVWNAFEAHLVPDDDTWFWLSLPLTVPAGFLAIASDTLVVHPIQVVDDAADDAADLWTEDGPEFAKHYYTELAYLPVRTALTPVVFTLSFLGRSLFDVRSRKVGTERISEEELAEHARAELRRWLESIANGDTPPFEPTQLSVSPATRELQEALARALRNGNGFGRLEVYLLAERFDWPLAELDRRLGLRDPDPVVRYELLRRLDRQLELGAELIEALRNDPNEVVRQTARHRWPPDR